MRLEGATVSMDEMEEGKQKFMEVVKGVDGAVQVVIPVTPSNSLFLISLTKGQNRKFITVSEDDIIDLPHEAGILSKVTKVVTDAVAAL
jgi:galactose-1-phosphate uridylyltransferase